MAIELEDRARALENEYFRQKEQELLAKMREKLEDEENKRTGLKCPKCDGILVETTFEAIVIDVCDKCQGVWLDAGELALIAHHDESKGGWLSSLFR
jgi:frataxin-like iron-binding protein CyaY